MYNIDPDSYDSPDTKYLQPMGVYNQPHSPSKISHIVDEYPITNHSWWSYGIGFTMKDQLLHDTITTDSTVGRYMNEIRLMDADIFFARLDNTRMVRDNTKVTAGFTYDPWWRNISYHRHNHYKGISLDKELSFHLGDNKHLAIWGFHSSIDKRPINLFLYHFFDIDDSDIMEKRAYLDSIHPYMAV
jgi:hypothetical protein